MNPSFRNSLVLLTLLAVSGCLPLEQPAPRADWAGKIPSAWYAPATRGEPVPVGWINDLGDRRLPGLVSEAIRNNPNLEALSASLDAAQANARKAGALLYPSLNLLSDYNQTNRFDQTSLQKKAGGNTQSIGYGPSLAMSWEVDLWGRLKNQKLAAYESAAAAAADLWFARQTLAANVARAYFFSVESRQQVALAEEFVANFQSTYDIVKARFDAGAVTMQDLATSTADLASSRQNAETARLTYRESLRTLEILLGRYPAGEISVAASLPSPSRRIPSGLPADLLGRRYDLIAAERNVASAFRSVKSARAALLPRISLTTGVGTSSSQLKALADPVSAAFTFGANLMQPLFDAGLLKSDVDIANAVQKQAIANYGSSVLSALQEVENALDSVSSLQKQEVNLSEAASNYATATEIAMTRYKEGATDLTSVLVVQRQELQARTLLLGVRNQRLAQRVNLYLSLGGDFDYVPALLETPVQRKAEAQVNAELP